LDIPFEDLKFVCGENEFNMTFKNMGQFPVGKNYVTEYLFAECADHLRADSLFVFGYRIDLMKRAREENRHTQKFKVYFEKVFVKKR